MSEQQTAPSATEIENAKGFLTGILERMKIEGGIEAQDEEGQICLDIKCDEGDLDRILGRRGQVIDALQHLVGKMLSKTREERGRPILVDAGGFRAKHIKGLEDLGAKMAERCKESGEPVKLRAMSAYDRRIVHMSLVDIEGVRTEGEGEGEDRRLVIYPENSSASE